MAIHAGRSGAGNFSTREGYRLGGGGGRGSLALALTLTLTLPLTPTPTLALTLTLALALALEPRGLRLVARDPRRGPAWGPRPETQGPRPVARECLERQ